jgi:hypothetical protein
MKKLSFGVTRVSSVRVERSRINRPPSPVPRRDPAKVSPSPIKGTVPRNVPLG